MERNGCKIPETSPRSLETSLGYETITLQTTLLSTLPSQITVLNQALSTLRYTQEQQEQRSSTSQSLSLPLPATVSLLSTREADLEQLNAQLKSLQQALPKKTRELEKVENDLKGLEEVREKVVGAAREAIRRREEAEKGGGGDEIEIRGRWLRGVEGGLKGMLGVEA